MDALAAQNKRHFELMERWLAIVGGATLIGYAAKKRTPLSGLLAIAGGDCIYCGITGSSAFMTAFGLGSGTWHSDNATMPYRTIRVDQSIVINRSPDEVYRFWRDLKKLPLFMKHVQSVTESWPKKTHWVAQGPAGKTMKWDADITNDEPGELISWKSLPSAQVNTAGSVRFTVGPNGDGTEVKVELQYHPPAGAAGRAFAKMLGDDFADQIAQDLQSLKQHLENAGHEASFSAR